MARSIRGLSGQFTRRTRTNPRQARRTRTAGVHHFVSSRNGTTLSVTDEATGSLLTAHSGCSPHRPASPSQTRAKGSICAAERVALCSKIKVLE